MAVEQPNTTLRDTVRPQVVPLPADQIVTTDGLIQQLQIPEVASLSRESVISFLANQSARLLEITSRPEIKTAAAEIPEYVHYDNAPVVTALSSDEQSALSEWRRERSALIQTQSDDGNLESLEKEVQSYIDEAVKNNPDLFGNGKSGTVDVIDQYMTGQMVQMNNEQKKKYQELLMLASRGGDPESVLLAMTYKNAQSSMNKIGQMLTVYKEQTGILDKLQADLDLKGFKKDGLTQVDMMKTNMEFSRTQADVMNLFQIMQKEMNRYETVMTSANSLGKSLNESLRGTIANFKAS
ncbi:MAG TPA: hypothetical protein VLJ37_07555 [bacterium]|nr:hypothetical protein [bacterium]